MVENLSTNGLLRVYKKIYESSPIINNHDFLVQKLLHRKGLTLVTWNVNSIRSRIVDENTAACRLNTRPVQKDSPLGSLIYVHKADIICFQETKCDSANLKCFGTHGEQNSNGYYTYWNCAVQKGRHGVGIWTKYQPDSVITTLKYLPSRCAHLQTEGRLLALYYGKTVIITTYSPNTLRAGTKTKKGYPKPEFITYRQDWDAAMAKWLDELDRTGFSVIWCGDFNVARDLRDHYKGTWTQQRYKKDPSKKLAKRIADGEKAEKIGGGAGFRLEERESFEKILGNRYIDVFRELYPNKIEFTYWDMIRGKSWRKSNNGLRIDYFVINKNLLKRVQKIQHLPNIGFSDTKDKVASDHAPILLNF